MDQIWITVGSLAITGFLVSLLAQYLKSMLAKTSQKMLMVLALSVLGGLVLYAMRFVPANAWAVILGVYASANTVYLLIMRWLNPPEGSGLGSAPVWPMNVPPPVPPSNVKVDEDAGVAVNA